MFTAPPPEQIDLIRNKKVSRLQQTVLRGQIVRSGESRQDCPQAGWLPVPVPVLGGAVHGPAKAGPVGVWCREHGMELGDALGDHHASVPVMGQLGHRAVVSEVHRGEVGDAALQSPAGKDLDEDCCQAGPAPFGGDRDGELGQL